MSRPQVEPGTVVAFTDVMCGWSTVAFRRFYAAYITAGSDKQVEGGAGSTTGTDRCDAASATRNPPFRP